MGCHCELFSDIFARRENRLTRLDPRPKLLLSLSLILGVLFSPTPLFPLAVLESSLAAMIVIRTPFRWMVFRMTAPLGVVLVLIFIQGFMGHSPSFRDFHILGLTVTLSGDGIQKGLLLGTRVLAASSVMLLLSLVTPAHRIFHVLQWMKAPDAWIEIAGMMYRHIFTLLDAVSDMIAAQRVRLGHSHLRKSLSSLGTVAGAVLLRSMDQAVSTHEAMVARGYQGRIPLEPMPPMGRKNWMGTGSAAILVSGIFWFCEILK